MFCGCVRVRTCPSGRAGCLLDSVLLEVLRGHRWEWGQEWSDQNNLLPPACSLGQLLNGRKPELILYWVKAIFLGLWMSSGALTAIPVEREESTNVHVPPISKRKEVRSWEYSLYQILLKTPFCDALLACSAMGKKEKYIVRGVWETSGACHTLKVEVKSQRVFQEL